MMVVWPLLILVALIGWGYAGVWVTRRLAGVEPDSLGESLALGLALVLAVAGLAVAFGVFNSLLVYIVVAVGIACAFVELVRRVRPGHGAMTRRHVLDVSVALLLIAAVLVPALWSTAHFLWDPCDDDAAYLYLARRLVLEGNLFDPMNFRRLTSLGGMSALQAVFLVRLPDSFLPLPDLFLGPLLILFGLWRSPCRRWAFWGIAATFLVILFPANLGPSNTSPVLIPVGLGIAALSVALQMRVQATTPRARMALACILGLLVGTATTLRPQFGILGLVAFFMACWPPLEFGVVERLAGLGTGFAIALGGWAIASWRAVGTPMFPLVTGNLDPSWPADGPPVGATSLTDFVDRIVPSLINPPWAVALLLGTGVVVLVLTRSQVAEMYRHWGLRLQVVAAVSSLVWVAILTRLFWTTGPPSLYPRYWAPMVLAAILMPLALINRAPGEHSKLAVLAGLPIFILVTVAMSANPIAGRHELRLIAQDTITGTVTNALYADRYANIRPEYAQAAALIPAGSKVLAAVDVPSLLISDSYELNTLDVAGSVSPPPHLPYFLGTQAKLKWLRDRGYDYIIAVDPAASACLYNGQLVAEDSIGKHGQASQGLAPFFTDWFSFLADVSDPSIASSTRVGTLIVVKL
jgi:hypothetical protein